MCLGPGIRQAQLRSFHRWTTMTACAEEGARVRTLIGTWAEIGKTRPAVVIGVEDIGVLPLTIVVPVTAWHSNFALQAWKVRLAPDENTGIVKESAADAFQIKSVSIVRIVERLGVLPSNVV